LLPRPARRRGGQLSARPSALSPLGHRQTQLRLPSTVQHPIIVLDHVAHGLVVALDKAGHNFALKAAVLTLFDDSLADDEFQQDSLFAHVTPRRPSATDRRTLIYRRMLWRISGAT